MSQVPDAWCLISFFCACRQQDTNYFEDQTQTVFGSTWNFHLIFNLSALREYSWVLSPATNLGRQSKGCWTMLPRIGDCKQTPNHLISLSLIFHFPCHVFRNYVYFNRFSALKRSGKIDKFKVRRVRASEIHIRVLVRNFKHARVDGWRVKTY